MPQDACTSVAGPVVQVSLQQARSSEWPQFQSSRLPTDRETATCVEGTLPGPQQNSAW